MTERTLSQSPRLQAEQGHLWLSLLDNSIVCLDLPTWARYWDRCDNIAVAEVVNDKLNVPLSAKAPDTLDRHL
jgi:hypothetical protein